MVSFGKAHDQITGNNMRYGIDARMINHSGIGTYIQNLRPVSSPYLAKGELSEAALRGKSIFDSEKGGCIECHPPPFYTDLDTHNVDTRAEYDASGNFDTPTLIECWRTAPYLHDGRYTIIQEVLREERHPPGQQLSDSEIDDLAAFVLSL